MNNYYTAEDIQAFLDFVGFAVKILIVWGVLLFTVWAYEKVTHHNS